MRTVILRQGSSGPFVRDLQLALNTRLNPSPNLQLSGVFAPQTERALTAFQRANWLEEDGIAGPCTLDVLYETETQPPILHPVPYIPQNTAAGGWAAATAMLVNTSSARVQNATPTHLLTSQGALPTQNSLGDGALMLQIFAKWHGLQFFAAQSWSVGALIGKVRQSPVMVSMLSRSHAPPRLPDLSGKYLVVVGARGSHTADGRSTTLRIFDPDPAHSDGVFSLTYTTVLRHAPHAAYGIFTRA